MGSQDFGKYPLNWIKDYLYCNNPQDWVTKIVHLFAVFETRSSQTRQKIKFRTMTQNRFDFFPGNSHDTLLSAIFQIDWSGRIGKEDSTIFYIREISIGLWGMIDVNLGLSCGPWGVFWSEFAKEKQTQVFIFPSLLPCLEKQQSNNPQFTHGNSLNHFQLRTQWKTSITWTKLLQQMMFVIAFSFQGYSSISIQISLKFDSNGPINRH